MSSEVRSSKDWTDPIGRSAYRVRAVASILAFVAAMAVAAHVRIFLPGTTIPFTLQPLVVLLAGLVLGARGGGAAMLSYLLIGAAGFPVFSSGGFGIAWLLGPTGGYLFAYPVAAVAVGLLSGGAQGSYLRTVGALVVGLVTIYLGGIAQLTILTGGNLAAAWVTGVLPFLVGDLLKVAVASVAGPWVRERLFGTR